MSQKSDSNLLNCSVDDFAEKIKGTTFASKKFLDKQLQRRLEILS